MIILLFLFLFLKLSAGIEESSTVINTSIPAVASNDIEKKNVQTEKHRIPINSSLPLTGDLSIVGNQIFDGMNLFFNKILQKKNNFHFSCALNVLDDGAIATKMKKNVDTMTKDASMFISLFGTDALSVVSKQIQDKSMLALFPIDGTIAFRKVEYKNLIFFRANFVQEVKALLEYAIKTLHKKNISIFYEDSDWGKSVFEEAKKVLEEFKITLKGSASYPQHTLNITPGAKKIVESAPNVILCIAQARPAYNFIQSIINQGLHKTTFLGLDSLASIQATLKKSRGVQIITSTVVPDPVRSNLAIAEEYRADNTLYSPNKQLTPFSFEGYINAALFVEGLKLATFPLVNENFVTIFEKLSHVKFKGLVLKFDASTRALSQSVWINKGDEEEWVLSSSDSSEKPPSVIKKETQENKQVSQ